LLPGDRHGVSANASKTKLSTLEGEEPGSNILQVLLRNQVELPRNLAGKFVLQEPKSDPALLNKEMCTSSAVKTLFQQ
jgi:hypothetical protein